MDNYLIDKKIRFKNIRNIVDELAKVSICDAKTLEYNNYISIREVSDKYDDLFVVGIGLIESECGKDEFNDIHYSGYLEIVVSDNPYVYKDKNGKFWLFIRMCGRKLSLFPVKY